MRAALACLVLVTAPCPTFAQERAETPISVASGGELEQQRRELRALEQEIARLRGRTNAVGNLNQQDLRRLEQLMHRRGQLARAIAAAAGAPTDGRAPSR